jgi:tRNA modification GTPase
MPIDLQDTITATASPPGASLRGIVRISGPETRQLLAGMFTATPETGDWHSATLPRRWPGTLQISAFCQPLPAALFFWPTQRSYTGQTMAELHLPGSEPVLEGVLEELCRRGARLARRGEFTMRAFLNGRMDLLQAEAVHGVIQAADHDELQRALGQLGGGITGNLRMLRTDLISLLGDLEAGLDFVDEDIEFVSNHEIRRRLGAALLLIQSLVSDAASRLPAGHRRRIVLAGLPNAGKSTLFNRLTGSQRAIVSPTAGTTRDYVSTPVILGNFTVDLVDTAGWEDTADSILSRAQEFRQEQIDAADLIVWCRAADLPAEQRVAECQLHRQLQNRGFDLLTVKTRSDLETTATPAPAEDIAISAATGAGLTALTERLVQALEKGNQARSELLGTSAVRCRESLQRAHTCLSQALQAAVDRSGDELISLELRQTLRELQIVLGEVYTDDLLDHIFSHFCIGK